LPQDVVHIVLLVHRYIGIDLEEDGVVLLPQLAHCLPEKLLTGLITVNADDRSPGSVKYRTVDYGNTPLEDRDGSDRVPFPFNQQSQGRPAGTALQLPPFVTLKKMRLGSLTDKAVELIPLTFSYRKGLVQLTSPSNPVC
jgi:hypothetical protein